ncbi:2-polyprenyl-6-methoxyphenol hydroxylase-like FAD-dependent oxidoreductase [Actinoplanes octamycinicus]|uniref:2-polyprenyl-6-methoxyphenol hydroxylase-like FAD-dependent oxidoreductase n=1 Tax=Actinoplanes octamycinicus TaxID=135948 RepID=A0A7W7MB08_9ACTN|nr:FAD-dependent monooxygenase [Actinoplanes octamycinicus]MBB4743552.1 2-polyprenyl-6-methoxyphenol hydroxylase-like FAD-dependent oxidoreductase [Actinoplanes octamycinicus]GIE62460.1 putative FAD-binding monooxygenase [Actinoplanes octamycinicus]
MDAVDVLIAGAGPTGLTLACDLARQGVACRIVDQSAGPGGGGRGFSLKPRSLAAFDDLGLAAAVTTAGSVERRTRFHQGTRRLFQLDTPPAPVTGTEPYPNVVALPQWRTEELLRDRLAELGGKVEFGRRVTGVAGGEVTLADGERVRARFVVGADGGRSTVRRLLDVPFTGRTDQDTRAMISDVRLTGLDPAGGVSMWLSADRGVAVARPVADTGVWQVVTSLGPHLAGDQETLQRLLVERSGLPGLRITEVLWHSVWRYNVRIAERFRVGPVFLAGDAAHVHSPFGGHGMNTGIQDAYNLGWKLGMVIRGLLPERVLESYEAERMPVARAILADSDQRMSGMMRWRFARPLAGPLLKRGFARQQRVTRRDHPVYPAGPLIGDGGGQPAPDGSLPTGARLFDLFRGSHFTVLGPGAVPGLDPDLVHVHRVGGDFRVVRPDGYLALTARTPGPVRDYFDRLTVARSVPVSLLQGRIRGGSTLAE